MIRMIETQNISNGIIIAEDVKSLAGYFRVNRESKRGKLVHVRRGVYATPEALATTIPDVEALIPRSVVCLHSAFFYHQLTTQIPAALSVAIEANRPVKAPQFPPMEIYYWKKEYLEIGVTEAEVEGHTVRITDMERTVCDAIRYRNKIGMDACGEVLTTYLQLPNRDIARLNMIARQMRVYNVLTTYLQTRL